jgi:hypothetical protein
MQQGRHLTQLPRFTHRREIEAKPHKAPRAQSFGLILARDVDAAAASAAMAFGAPSLATAERP